MCQIPGIAVTLLCAPGRALQTCQDECRCVGAGMMWAWDLSATLGWTAGGGPGGSWLERSTSSPWEVRMRPESVYHTNGIWSFINT